MPLTPADVHNVAFKKPPIGKRGYDEEEVDAFLDEVERELARLIEENNELRAGGRAAPQERAEHNLVGIIIHEVVQRARRILRGSKGKDNDGKRESHARYCEH